VLVESYDFFGCPGVVVGKRSTSFADRSKFVGDAMRRTASGFAAQLLTQRKKDCVGYGLTRLIGQGSRQKVGIRMFYTQRHKIALWYSFLPEY
jgi:hypothetical protein